MPGPTHSGPGSGRLAGNADCVRCHPQQAAEWRSSQHRSAHTDPDYQRVVVHERGSFCQTCHAPEAPPQTTPSSDDGAVGVACVTCHVPAGVDGVLAAPGSMHTEAHTLVRTAEFAAVDACAGCHQFAFPRNPDVDMQATVTEHAESAFADTPCADCHMPWTGEGPERHRDHTFAASRDPQMLQAAVVVDAERNDGAVTLRLSPGRIGHAFPTGDLFRRLWVDVEVLDPHGEALAYDGRALARRFTRGGGHLLGDDRPGAPSQREHGGAIEARFELGEVARSRSIRWQVFHQRVALPLDGDEAELFGQTLVTSGVLAPRQP